MLQIFHANLETRNFSFDTYGHNEVEALYVMERAWREHMRQTGATDGWSDVVGDVNVVPVLVGAAYRDNTLLPIDKR